MEHITTKEGVDFVMSAPDNVGGTITAHHLLYNRNHLLVGGIKVRGKGELSHGLPERSDTN